MGWVITTWHTDRLAALLDADTRDAAEDVVRRADRDARRLRRAARREAAGVAATLEGLERLGTEAREDVRRERRRRRDGEAPPGPTRPRADAAAPIAARVRRADALARLTADVRAAATGEPAPRRPQPARLAPARPRPAAAPAPAPAAPAPPLAERPGWWAPDTPPGRVDTADPVPPPVPPTAPVRRRRFQREEAPPEVAPVPRRQTSGPRRGRASLRESVLNDLFRSTELPDRASQPAG
jgi:hypothetical protein